MGLTPFDLSPREKDAVNQNTKLLVSARREPAWTGGVFLLPGPARHSSLCDDGPGPADAYLKSVRAGRILVLSVPLVPPKSVHKAFLSVAARVTGVCLTWAHF